MPTLSHIWRYPIKAVGREAVNSANLEANQTLEWDRVWAIAHETSKLADINSSDWAQCMNFIRGASSPELMTVSATVDENEQTVTLRHRDRPDLTIDPDNGSSALIEWVRPLVPSHRASPSHVVRSTERGMTDSRHPTLSLIGQASRKDLSKRTGKNLAMERFRANLWVDDIEPWQEFEWIGKNIRIGDAVLNITKPIERCTATMVNPENAEIDAATLDVLKTQLGHKNLGVQARVIQSGAIHIDDTIEVIE